MTAGVRCHNPDACCAGQKPCPSPGACGVATTVGTADLEAAITSSRDAYFAHHGHLLRTPHLERLFAEAFTLGADYVLDAPQPNAALADGWMRKPLTTAQMEAGREAIFSTGNPFCPCDSKTFRKVAQWVEHHHRIEDAPPTLNASKEGRDHGAQEG